MVYRTPVHRGLHRGIQAMTRIQQVHWELEMDYIGHPYYVSGNAIMHALGQQLPQNIHQHLHASHAIFVPGQFGAYPDAHSQSGARPFMGASQPPVESYEDLFLFRQPSHPWLLDSRPRDGLNLHDIRVHSGHPALTNETIIGKPDSAKKHHQTTTWYINAYLHADHDDCLPIDETLLDGLQFGGKRNYGYGITQLKDTQVVDLAALDYSRIQNGEAFSIQLMTPYVLESEYPNAADQNVPWWWQADRHDLRERTEKILEQHTVYNLQIVDHGQTLRYLGDQPVETAKNGLLRVGSHSKYGFGELRLAPIKRQPNHDSAPAEPPNSDRTR